MWIWVVHTTSCQVEQICLCSVVVLLSYANEVVAVELAIVFVQQTSNVVLVVREVKLSSRVE